MTSDETPLLLPPHISIVDRKDPVWFRLPRIPDLSKALALAGLFPLLFGLLYSRYYFYRLSFPYQFLELPTTFFLFRSLAPISITMCFLVFLGAFLIPIHVLLTLLKIICNLPLLAKLLPATSFRREVIAATIIDAIIVFSCLRLGWWMMGIVGYGYLRDVRLVPVFALVGGAQLAKLVGQIVYPTYPFEHLRWNAATVQANRLRKVYVASVLTGMALTLAASVTAAVMLGRYEAEKLIEGDSRHSMFVDITLEDGSRLPGSPFILVMIMNDSYYLTRLQRPAPPKPLIVVVPDSRIARVSLRRVRDEDDLN